MTLIIIFFILSLTLNIALIYACYNLYNKIDTYEDVIINTYDEIIRSVNQMRMIDEHGAFEADDEVGYTFQSLLKIVNQLGNFINVKKEE